MQTLWIEFTCKSLHYECALWPPPPPPKRHSQACSFSCLMEQTARQLCRCRVKTDAHARRTGPFGALISARRTWQHNVWPGSAAAGDHHNDGDARPRLILRRPYGLDGYARALVSKRVQVGDVSACFRATSHESAACPSCDLENRSLISVPLFKLFKMMRWRFARADAAYRFLTDPKGATCWRIRRPR